MGDDGGGFVSGIMGLINPKAGKVSARATPFDQTKAYDPNAQFYNGSANGLQDYTNSLQLDKGGTDARQANTANFGNASGYTGVQNSYDVQANQAGQNQGQVANLMMGRATGAIPTVASQQGALDMGKLQAAQQAQQSSARGAAGLALAGQTAANNTATGQAALAGQTQVNSANERNQAQQSALGAYQGMQQGAQASQGLAQQMHSQLQQQDEFNAQQQQANRDSNDQRAIGDQQMVSQANAQQLQARQNNQQMLAQSQQGTNALNMGAASQNAGRTGQVYDAFAGGVNSAAGSATSAVSGMAKGGPAAHGKVYLMGEQGPELVVPRCNGGTVLSPGGRRADGGPVDGMQSMLDDRFAQQQDAGAKSDFDSWAKSYTDKGTPDLTPQRPTGPVQSQAAWESQLTGGQKPTTGADSMAQWGKSFGSPSKATAGARDPQQKPAWQRLLGGLSGKQKQQPQTITLNLGGGRESGGPVEGVQHLYETPETGPLDTAGYSQAKTDTSRPSLSGDYTGPGASHASAPMLAKGGRGGAPSKASRAMTPDELMRAADAMGSQMSSEHSARMSQGPAVSYGGGRAMGGPVDGYAGGFGGNGNDNGLAAMNSLYEQARTGTGKMAADMGNMANYGGGREEGGPVQGAGGGSDKPYLVGQKGPELVVPKKDATVIPAPQTAAILSKGTLPPPKAPPVGEASRPDASTMPPLPPPEQGQAPMRSSRNGPIAHRMRELPHYAAPPASAPREPAPNPTPLPAPFAPPPDSLAAWQQAAAAAGQPGAVQAEAPGPMLAKGGKKKR